jgi:ComF family protein
VVKNDLILKAWNVILPEYCLGCNKKGSLLCNQCYLLIHFNPTPTKNFLFQQDCLDQVLCLATYQPPISNLIRGLKYHNIKKISVVLADLLYYHLNIKIYHVITWVPTSKKRINERGFNQAQLIAENLAIKLNINSLALIKKTRHTHKQAQSSFQQRMHNLKKSFLINDWSPVFIKNKNILILDDVVSTGSTLNECAKILKKAGAKTVTGLAIAKS